MKLKSKRKSKQNVYSVDFVTAYTVEECRAYLTHKDLEGSDYTQQAYVGETGYFTIERTITWGVPPRHGFTMTPKFRGQLDPIPNGTHVSGAITDEALTRINESLLAQRIMTLIMLIITIMVIWKRDDMFFLLWLFIACLWTIFYAYWHVASTRAHALANWVQTQLYVLPSDDSA